MWGARGLVVVSVAMAGVFAYQLLRKFPKLGSMSMSSSSAATGVSFCFVTAPTKEAANKLADAVVEQKLAACVNIIPGIESTYLWQGKVERDAEILMMIKTRSSLTSELAEFVKNNHPYDVPEVICSDVKDGLPAYLQWVLESTKSPS